MSQILENLKFRKYELPIYYIKEFPYSFRLLSESPDQIRLVTDLPYGVWTSSQISMALYNFKTLLIRHLNLDSYSIDVRLPVSRELPNKYSSVSFWTRDNLDKGVGKCECALFPIIEISKVPGVLSIKIPSLDSIDRCSSVGSKFVYKDTRFTLVGFEVHNSYVSYYLVPDTSLVFGQSPSYKEGLTLAKLYAKNLESLFINCHTYVRYLTLEESNELVYNCITPSFYGSYIKDNPNLVDGQVRPLIRLDIYKD